MPPKDKKSDKPGDKKPAGWNFDPIEGIFVLLFAIAFVSSVVPMIWSYVTSGEISFFGIHLSTIYNFFAENIQIFKTIGFLIAGVAAIGTFVYTKKGDAVWKAKKAELYPIDIPKAGDPVVPASNPTADKWKEIVKKSESTSETDWRLAIIEADIILDSLLEKLNLPGSTIGEKLKAVEPSDFLTLDQAWEAHKARNNIAHQGSEFLLNQREARRIISLYEVVFKEFKLV